MYVCHQPYLLHVLNDGIILFLDMKLLKSCKIKYILIWSMSGLN